MALTSETVLYVEDCCFKAKYGAVSNALILTSATLPPICSVLWAQIIFQGSLKINFFTHKEPLLQKCYSGEGVVFHRLYRMDNIVSKSLWNRTGETKLQWELQDGFVLLCSDLHLTLLVRQIEETLYLLFSVFQQNHWFVIKDELSI